jgi:hypothetical protein
MRRLSDATVLDRDHIVTLERDNNEGPAAEWKRRLRAR